jgi:hypothetical protein
MRIKDALYYGIAGLLFLASVPIYRYIIMHGRSGAAHDEAASHYEQPAQPDVKQPVDGTRRCVNGNEYALDAAGTSAQLVGKCHSSAGDVVVTPENKLFYAWNEQLPDGYRCSGADGLVYRTRMENGATVVTPGCAPGSR